MYSIFLSKTGAFLRRALRSVNDVVSDDLLKMAVDWARLAVEKGLTNDTSREFVVKMIMARGISESVARLATELAVQLLKREAR